MSKSPSTNRIVVNVKRKHIAAGKCGRPSACAVALALREQFDPEARTYVWDALVGGVKYMVSYRLGQFIEDFDEGKKVKPGRFTLTRAL